MTIPAPSRDNPDAAALEYFNKKRRRPRHFEDNEQMLLIAVLMNVWYGEKCIGKTIFHIPNGGKRNKREAGRLKKLGVRPGVADLLLPIAIRGYHGMFIEMKFGDNQPTDFQRDFGIEVEREGYIYVVHNQWEDAANHIIGYLRNGNREVRAPKIHPRAPVTAKPVKPIEYKHPKGYTL